MVFKKICYKSRKDHQPDASVVQTWFSDFHALNRELTTNCPSSLHDDEASYFKKYYMILGCWTLATIASIFISISSAYQGHRFFKREPEAYLAILAGVSFLILIYLNAKLLGKHSWTKKHLGTLLIPTFISIVFGFFGVIPYFNEFLDQGASHSVVAILQNKYKQTGKGGPYYELVYGYRDPFDNSYTANVGYQEWTTHTLGETTTFDVHPGFFHMEWVVNH